MIEGGDVVDWGTIKDQEEPLKTKIKILNIGNDTLRITSVKPGCGCTTAPLPKTVIEPNGFSIMDVTMKLPGNGGKFAKNIDIRSNDLIDSLKVIWLRMEVIFPISFFPQKGIKMGTMVMGTENTGKVIIKNSTDEKVYFKQIEVTPPELKINIKNDDFIPPNTSYTLEVKYTPDGPGAFNGKVFFKTTEPNNPRIEFPVYGIVY
jgi:hypothetical protein